MREFTVNDVYYFIRKMGLTPIIEDTYVYHIDDTVPPLPGAASLFKKFKRIIIKTIKYTCSKIMPKRIFLRLVGGGGYYCIATFDRNIIVK